MFNTKSNNEIQNVKSESNFNELTVFINFRSLKSREIVPVMLKSGLNKENKDIVIMYIDGNSYELDGGILDVIISYLSIFRVLPALDYAKICIFTTKFKNTAQEDIPVKISYEQGLLDMSIALSIGNNAYVSFDIPFVSDFLRFASLARFKFEKSYKNISNNKSLSLNNNNNGIKENIIVKVNKKEELKNEETELAEKIGKFCLHKFFKEDTSEKHINCKNGKNDDVKINSDKSINKITTILNF